MEGELSLSEAWENAKAKVEAAEGTTVESAPAKEAPEPEKTEVDLEKPERVEAAEETTELGAEEREAALAELKEKAKALGLTVKDGAVETKEHVALRRERRQAEARLKAQETELTQAWEQKVTELEGEIRSARAVRQVIESRDFDALAKMAGYKSFGQLASDYAQGASDPLNRKVQSLEQKLAAKEAAEQAAREEYRRSQQAQAQQAQVEAYFEEVKSELSSHEDSRIAALADDEAFLASIVEVQRKHWNKATQTTLDTSAAAELVFKEVRESVERYSRVLSRENPREAAAASDASEGKRKLPRSVSQSQIAQASAGKQEMSDAESIRHWASKLRQENLARR